MTRKTETKFLNITQVVGANYTGYQAKVTVDGVEHQPYVGGLDERSLRKVLRERNALWRKFGTTARGILLTPLQLPVKSDSSSSGWLGICAKQRVERSGTTLDVFGVRLRNLFTGKQTSREVRCHQFKSDAAALGAAKRLAVRNITAYNAVVAEYNAMALRDAMVLAEEEVRLLTPLLDRLTQFDLERWELSLQCVYPESLCCSVDPEKGASQRVYERAA